MSNLIPFHFEAHEVRILDILPALKDGDSCCPWRGKQAFHLSRCPRARIFLAATTSAW
jgi:hypothetical protein